jgi:hypothetical protein
MVAIHQVFVFFVPEITFASALLKEALIWLNAVALIVIIRRGEHLPLRSIGLRTARWWKSILWGFLIAIVSAVAVGHQTTDDRRQTWTRARVGWIEPMGGELLKRSIARNRYR